MAAATFSELTEQQAKNLIYHGLLADSQLMQAKVFQAQQSTYAAKKLCQQITEHLAPIVNNNKDPRYLITYSQALDCLGELPQHPELLKLLQQNAIVDIYFNP